MDNYLGILRVLGAASFGLGGIAFLLSFRWRMDGLKLVRHHIRWDASVITIIAISAALNAGAAIITGPIRFGWISFRPGAAITPVLGILFGIPGAIGAGLGNVISDILKGFISPASVSGFLGNFFAFALIPGMIVRDASLKNKNSWMQYIVGICVGAGFGMLSMPWFIDVTGTMPPVAAWTTEPFALLMNRILSPLLLGPVFLKILYPFTVKNGMYWRQENTATVENL